MHEYRLTEAKHQPLKQHGSMRLDDWVLCRIYKKRSMVRTEEKTEDSSTSQAQLSIGGTSDISSDQQNTTKFPRTHSLSYLLDLDYLGPIAHLLNDNTYNPSFDAQTSMGLNNATLDPNINPYPNIGLSCQHSNGNFYFK